MNILFLVALWRGVAVVTPAAPFMGVGSGIPFAHQPTNRLREVPTEPRLGRRARRLLRRAEQAASAAIPEVEASPSPEPLPVIGRAPGLDAVLSDAPRPLVDSAVASFELRPKPYTPPVAASEPWLTDDDIDALLFTLAEA